MARKIKLTGVKDAIIGNSDFRELVEDVAKNTLKERVNVLVDEIEAHPISQEIRAGESSTNSSGALGGYGNLFTFLGGFDGDVVGRIVQNIIAKSKLGRVTAVNSASKDILFRGDVALRLDQVDENLSFENRGVIDAVENGLGNFSNYVYHKGKELDGSRTGPAVQSKKKFENRSYTPKEWIGSLLRAF
jgi:hypothetical protein